MWILSPGASYTSFREKIGQCWHAILHHCLHWIAFSWYYPIFKVLKHCQREKHTVTTFHVKKWINWKTLSKNSQTQRLWSSRRLHRIPDDRSGPLAHPQRLWYFHWLGPPFDTLHHLSRDISTTKLIESKIGKSKITKFIEPKFSGDQYVIINVIIHWRSCRHIFSLH